jgi:hypothetical protein
MMADRDREYRPHGGRPGRLLGCHTEGPGLLDIENMPQNDST